MNTKIKELSIVLFLFVILLNSFSESNKGGIIYGDNWAYTVIAPDGWIMDSTSWANNNIFALFYKENTKLEPPNPIIYINSTKLVSADEKGISIYIEEDIKNYSNDKSNKIFVLDSFTDKVGNKIKIVKYSLTNGKRYEVVAYYRQKDTVHMIILTVFSDKDVDDNMKNVYSIINNISPMDKN